MNDAASILINFIPMAVIAWFVYRKQSLEVKVFYWPALALKLLAGMSVGWVYFYHYGAGDTVSYWYDGKIVAEKILSKPGEAISFFWNDDQQTVEGLLNSKPRSIFFVKISGILALVSWGNYWVMAAIISFISFYGAWFLFGKVVEFIPASRLAAAISFLFFPSVVFWSSGLIKESIGLASLFFLAGIFLAMIHGERIRTWQWLIGIVSLWIGWNLKYYWVAIFMPVAITTVAVVILTRSRASWERFNLAIWLGLFTILLLIATNTHPNFYIQRFFEVIVENNKEFIMLTGPDNLIYYQDLKPTFFSVLLNSPQGLIAGLFRPAIWEAHNVLSLLAGIENFMVLIMVGSNISSLSGFFSSPRRPLILAVIVYILFLSIFLSLSTPNLGTLSRYKIGFTPFLVFLALYKNPLVTWVKSWRSNR